MSSSSGPVYNYRFVGMPTSRRAVSTSRAEVTQILIAFAVLTGDLVLITSQSTVLFGSAGTGFLQSITLVIVLVSAAAALTGFVAHELAHKVVAQRRGFWAEFRMSPIGLLISAATAYFGLLWAAPGATVVSGMPVDARPDWGKTSLAGPMANAVFAVVFYAGATEAFLRGSSLYLWLLLLAWINGWFGTFNLVPLGMLDGRKVLRWNVGIWAGAIVLTGALAVVSWVALYYYHTPFLGL